VTESPSSPGLRPTLPDWAVVSPARREHIARVAELAGRWALEMGVPESERNRWLRAVWLHDALRDAPEAELVRWAADAPAALELRHGPASAAHAASAKSSATSGSARAVAGRKRSSVGAAGSADIKKRAAEKPRAGESSASEASAFHGSSACRRQHSIPRGLPSTNGCLYDRGRRPPRPRGARRAGARTSAL
jgi:hypothetical protein